MCRCILSMQGVFVARTGLATIQFSLGVLSTTPRCGPGSRSLSTQRVLTANRWIYAKSFGFSPTSLMARPGGIASALQSISNLEMSARRIWTAGRVPFARQLCRPARSIR